MYVNLRVILFFYLTSSFFIYTSSYRFLGVFKPFLFFEFVRLSSLNVFRYRVLVSFSMDTYNWRLKTFSFYSSFIIFVSFYYEVHPCY